MENPIRRIASREVHKGKLVRLREDTVVLPKGTEDIFEYVEIKNGSSVLAMEDNGDVWLVREWKYAIGHHSLEVVSGGLEPGEAPEAGGRRELREELGIEAREWTALHHVDPFTSMLSCPNHMFLARGLTHVETEREEAEVIEPMRVPLQQAVQLVLDGTITHGTSCVLILKAELLRTYNQLPGQ